jgi:hypothetical protein
MRKQFLAPIFAILLASPVWAGAVTQYEAWKFGKPGGYREKPKGPGRWFVRADSTSSSIPDFALAMALHRAAIRMAAEGFSHFSIVNFEINNRQFCRGCSYGNQDVYLTVVGLADSIGPAKCEAKPSFVKNCETLSVAETLARYGRLLNRTPAQQAEEQALIAKR